MPPYKQIHWEYLVYLFAGGILVAALFLLALQSRELNLPFGRRGKEKEEEIHHFGEVSEGNRPLPLFIAVIFVLFVLWAFFYTIYSGKHFPA